MERRLNKRYKGSGFVYVCPNGQTRRKLPIGNLSARGVFVRSSGYALPLDTAVDLVFVVNLGSITKLYHRKAVVAHRSREGMGLLLHRTIRQGVEPSLRMHS